MDDQERDENEVEMVDLDQEPILTSPTRFAKSISKLTIWKQSARIRNTFFISTFLICILILTFVLGLRLPSLSLFKQAPAPSTTSKTSVIPGDRNFISAQIANGLVYIQTPDGTLSVRQANTGKERWRLKAGSSDLFEVLNQAIYRLTCPSHENCSLEARNALNGILLWVRQLPPAAAAPLMGDSNVLYFHAYDGMLLAINPGNGKILWQYATHTPEALSFSIAASTISFLDQNAHIHILRSSNGTQLLSYQLVGSGGFPSYQLVGPGGFPFVDKNTLYYQSSPITITALNLNNGHQLWQYTTSEDAFSLWEVQDNQVYLEDNNQQGILALSGTTGKLLWQYNALLNAAPIIQRGILYAPLQGNTIFALQASNGSPLWRQIVSPFQYGILAAGDVICLGQNNSIQALGNDGTIRWIYTTHNAISWYPEQSNGILLINYTTGNVAFDVIRASDGTVLWQYVS